MAQIIEIKVPNIGDFDAVEVIEVAVQEGQEIAQEDALITLETDKAAMDVPSPHAGVIQSLTIKAGDKVKEGDVILKLQTDAEPKTNGKDSAPIAEQPEPQPQLVEASTPTSEGRPVEKNIELPDLGTDGEVSVIEWQVQVGDTVEADQSIMTLESDKASMDVPSQDGGKIVALLVNVGDKVQSFQAVAKILTKSSAEPASQPTSVPSAKPAEPAKTSAASDSEKPAPDFRAMPATTGAVHAGPGVRRLAHQLGVNLSLIQGKGHKGRIIYEDVHAYVKQALQQSGGATQTGLGLEPMPAIDFSQWGEVDVKPLSRIKKLTAKNLHRNWVQIPHVTHFDEADISELERFRNENKGQAKKMGFSLTPLAFILKAVVSSLQAFPQFNSSLDANGTDLIVKKYFHIGIAVDTPNGLVVPVLRDVDQKGLFDLAKEMSELGGKAREGRLKREEMQGSCFSISSLGSIGGTSFTPIINAPDVAILGVSKAQMKPVYDGDGFVPKLILPLSLSYDHRVIDGAEAAQFMRHLCAQLEDIRKLLL